MIDALRERFHAVYLKGERDKTLRTDIPEGKMFSATLHLMLAMVTRYAVGLVYDAGVAPEEELLAMNRLGAAAVLLSKGTPFFLAGEEQLRSKDGDENSYNSSDEVNNIRWDNLSEGSDEFKNYMLRAYGGCRGI